MRRTLALGILAVMAVVPAARVEGEVVLHDTSVVLDQTLVREAEATAYVTVRGATGLNTSRAIAGADVAVSLEREVDEKVESHALAGARTGADGKLVCKFTVPSVAPGDYQLVARTRSEHGEDTVRRAVAVTNHLLLHLRTDRPVYKAGQAIRWRVTALSATDAHPKVDLPVELTVQDPRGTKIWRGRVNTDESGMVSGELPLGDDLVLGEYRLSAGADGTTTVETVRVREFVMPAFSVEIKPSKPGPFAPGSTVEGDVVAAYHYGEPVVGDVRVDTGRSAGEPVALERGRHHFSLTAPREGGAFSLTAIVTDGAGRRQEASVDLQLEASRLEIAVIPEHREYVPGQDLQITVVTTDGSGAFVPARVILKRAREARGQGVDSPGATRFTFKPDDNDWRLDLEAIAVTSDNRTASTVVYVNRDQGGAQVRPRDIVVAEGAPLRVDGDWPRGHGPVLATLLRNGAPVAAALASIDAAGVVRVEMAAPQGVFGLATVRLVDIGFDAANGRMYGTNAQASVYLRPARLDVTIDGATRHKPGEEARLSVLVRDAEGRPVPGAGLAASVVDERVLALGEPRPDLAVVLGSLDVSNARAAGIAFAELLGRDDEPSRLALRALVEALPPDLAVPLIRSDAAERIAAELARLEKAQPAVYRVLLTDEKPIGKKIGARWEFAAELHELLDRARWKADERDTPWREPTTWVYARQLLPEWTFDRVAGEIAGERLDLLEARLLAVRKTSRRALHRKRTEALRALVDKGTIEAYLAVDPWGNAIQVERQNDGDTDYITLVSLGPDGKLDTPDDLRRVDVYRESSGFGWGSGSGYGAGGGGYGAGSVGLGRYGTIGHGAGSPEPSVALRQRFDETVLWVTGVRTGADGRAALEVPLADSITGWEVRVEAVSGGGAVGTRTARMETFLPLHADVEPPAALTTGDRYSLPVVIANHSGGKKRLRARATVAGAVRLTGEGRQTIELAAGATGALSFPIEATAAGTANLEITLTGDDGVAVDRMARTLRVEPPGSLARVIQTGQVAEGTTSLSLTLPASALASTAGARLRVYRGAVDQAMDGLEELLREPHGCFEQTSSSTHPNLLVLELLGDRPGTEAIRQRARDYVARGYQRLISYEVPGGGYSWFGDAPANQVLTAYGLLEFTDMARVYPVDPDVIARTREWLLRKQRSDGSWKPDENWLHDWSAVQGKVSTTAYIAWALAEAGERGKGLKDALGFLRDHESALAEDPYLLALWAGAEAAAGSKPGTPLRLLAKHETRKDGKSRFRAGGRTLFYSTGTGADVQVTALTATALRRAGRREEAGRAVSWVWDARAEGGWDTTQGVVVALRAAAAMQEKEPSPTGRLVVRVDGKLAGHLDLASDGIPTVDLAGFAAGDHTVTIEGAPKATLLYDLRLRYREAAEPRPIASGITVELTGPAAAAHVGDVVPLALRLHNPGKEVIPMPTVVVPVPPGFRASTGSLAALVAKQAISKYEDNGSEIHLYLEQLAPGAEAKLAIAWEAIAVCQVMQRPAVAYAYYDPAVRGASAVARLVTTSR